MNCPICETSATSEVSQGRLHVACSDCALANLCLPRSLDGEGLEEFEKLVQKLRPLQRGEHIFRAGDAFGAIISVRSGSFKSYVINQHGEEQVLGFHLPGEIVGLDAIHSSTHTANVVALDTSSVCALNFSSIAELSRLLPELQAELFRIMSRNIAELEANAADLTADQRIARFLLSLSARFERRGYSRQEFNLSMARRDIASHLRLATETVSRVLARFQESGLVSVNRKNIMINDFEGLEHAAGPAA